MRTMWSQWVQTPKVLFVIGVAAVGVMSTLAVAAQVNTNNTASIQTAAATTYSSVSAAFNNTAISDNASPASANFDASGNSYSYQDLAALGWKPGQAVTYAGNKLTWPNVAAGAKDNVVAAGQKITLSGKGSALTFLAASDHGPATGTGTLTYSDGTTASFTLNTPDWVAGNVAQNIVAGPHRNNPSGQVTAPASIYPVSIPLNTAKTLSAVTLPSTVDKGRLHVFTMAIKPITAGWSGSWSTANETAVSVPWKDETLRMVAHTSLGGTQVRLRFSNTMNTVPVTLGHVTVAIQKDGWVPKGYTTNVTFGGSQSVTMPAGGEVTSDPVALSVPANSRLLISEYLPGDVRSATIHYNALQTNFNAPAGAGDHTTDGGNYPVNNAFIFSAFLSGVDVNSNAGSIVTLGDSITDGIGSNFDADTRWPDYLSYRLGGTRGVANVGIAGNQVLKDQMTGNGISAVNRFYRDVMSVPNIKSVVFLEGINDVDSGALATDVELAIKNIVTMAHQYGLKISVSTLTPFGGGSASIETQHQAVNAWVRAGGSGANYTIDFADAISGGGSPEGMYGPYDSGDHLHPNSAGYNSMAGWLDTTKL